MEAGWHRTAIQGTFGATVAGSLVLDLTPAEAEHAVSIAYSQTAGHLQVTEGGATKRLQPGNAAAAGVTSALLARNGLTGPTDPWFGRFGFYETYENDAYDPDTIFDGLGESFSVADLSLKPYPCCRYVHTTVEAGLELRETQGLTLADVESATIFVNADAHTACAEPSGVRYAPETFIQLQFNLPYALAVALSDGRPVLSHFTNEAIGRANELPLSRIETAVTDEFDEAFADRISPARVRVTTTDGETHEVTRIDPKGHPNDRMTDEEFRRKFSECIEFAGLDLEPETVDELLALFDELEGLDSVEPVFAALEGGD
jgi:2-methylcitrate dehydratase PrpD